MKNVNKRALCLHYDTESHRFLKLSGLRREVSARIAAQHTPIRQMCGVSEKGQRNGCDLCVLDLHQELEEESLLCADCVEEHESKEHYVDKILY